MAITHMHQSKLQRIDLRTTTEIKDTLALAAKLLGTTVSGFLIGTAYKQAQSLLNEQQSIKLNDTERERFFAILDNPPAPNEKLKRAARQYQKIKNA